MKGGTWLKVDGKKVAAVRDKDGKPVPVTTAKKAPAAKSKAKEG